ncbi:MAG: hypothetical protein O6943_10275 [Bacteroidetes bacterium]|nr:hypothetical protein [Bacteroidota bacterium]
MNILIKASIYHLLFLYSMVAFSQERIPASPQIVIKIALGETVTAGNVILKFVEVLEDSRCPKDVVCIWEGRAKVKVVISGESISLKELELTVGEKNKNILVVFNGFTFKAVGLTPYPSSGITGKPSYTLMVLKEKI